MISRAEIDGKSIEYLARSTQGELLRETSRDPEVWVGPRVTDASIWGDIRQYENLFERV